MHPHGDHDDCTLVNGGDDRLSTKFNLVKMRLLRDELNAAAVVQKLPKLPLYLRMVAETSPVALFNVMTFCICLPQTREAVSPAN